MSISPRKFLERLNVVELKEFGLQAGISTDPATGNPILNVGFALSVGSKKTTRDDARALIIYLDDNRILYEQPAAWEHVGYSIKSVTTLRKHLGKKLLPTLPSDTVIFKCVEQMRNACRDFMKITERMEQPEKGFFAYKDKNYRLFDTAVGRIRREFGRALLTLSLAYDVEITDNLAKIISASPNHDSKLIEEPEGE